MPAGRGAWPLLLLAWPLLLLAAGCRLQVLAIEPEGEGGVIEYTTAFINVSWVDTDLQALHTESSETGRYSVAGAASVSGPARLLLPLTVGGVPEHLGCGPAAPFPASEPPFVAVVRRGGCEFDVKVAHAVSAGAAAVVIYNNVESAALETVQVAAGTGIPVVFTFRWRGEQVAGLLAAGRPVTLGLRAGRTCTRGPAGLFACPADGSRPGVAPGGSSSRSVMFVSISFIVLMMISLAWLLFYYVQRFRVLHAKEAWERRLGRQARRALASVELVVVGEGGEEAECTVCLDSLAAGEETRRLPCQHVFHRRCIDHWLLTRRKCPLCNLNIIRHFGLGGEGAREEGGEASQALPVTRL